MHHQDDMINHEEPKVFIHYLVFSISGDLNQSQTIPY